MQLPMQQNGAIFIDYENILYHLQKEFASPPEVHDIILELLRTLRQKLQTEMGIDPIIVKAYGDFEKIANAPLGSLYLMGVDTHNVMGTEHKNAADMQLCIHLMEAFYTRHDISTFVLLAGDRDYIPIVQYLRSKAKKVLAVAFKKSISGDLRLILGEENTLDALAFLPQGRKEALKIHVDDYVKNMGLNIVGKIELPARPAKTNANVEAAKQAAPIKSTEPNAPEMPPHFPNVKPIVNEPAVRCLNLLLQFKEERKIKEVWLTPFLRILNEHMSLLADYERKNLIQELTMYGAIKVIKKFSESLGYDYSVIQINYNHPTVLKNMP